jgi:hypothetical protein
MNGISENFGGFGMRIREGLKNDICLKTAMLSGRRFSASSRSFRRKAQALFLVSSAFAALSSLSPENGELFELLKGCRDYAEKKRHIPVIINNNYGK